MSRHNRRDFLKRAAAGGLSPPRLPSAARRPRAGCWGPTIGSASPWPASTAAAWSIFRRSAGMKNVEVAYLVDPDSRLFASRSEVREEARRQHAQVRAGPAQRSWTTRTWTPSRSPRRNHWHSLLAIWACQAGKDVYVEKPCSHNIFEGRKLRRGGAQVRPHRAARHAKPLRSAAGPSRWRPSAAASTASCWSPTATPASRGGASASSCRRSRRKELDFDLWLGPAPQQPYHENLVHYNWHWFWDFGNGEIGNQGVHQMDIARWAMPDGAVPTSVISLGGRFGYKDQGQTPNTQLTVIDFGGPKIIFEDRGLVNGKTAR